MKEGFFEGKDFGKGDFKALMPKYYPPKYKQYIKEEIALLQKKVKGAKRILEAGVGTGRLIPNLAPIVDEFIGIDNADLMLEKSKKTAKKFSNVKIVKGELENLSKLFSENYFDFSLCMWNTLGNIRNETKILKELSKVTSKSIFITVYHKGTLEDRKNWYKIVGVKISKIDKENEIFYSESGLKSKSYNVMDIKIIARKAKLEVLDYKIFSNVILWVELRKTA